MLKDIEEMYDSRKLASPLLKLSISALRLVARTERIFLVFIASEVDFTTLRKSLATP